MRKLQTAFAALLLGSVLFIQPTWASDGTNGRLAVSIYVAKSNALEFPRLKEKRFNFLKRRIVENGHVHMSVACVGLGPTLGVQSETRLVDGDDTNIAVLDVVEVEGSHDRREPVFFRWSGHDYAPGPGLMRDHA